MPEPAAGRSGGSPQSRWSIDALYAAVSLIPPRREPLGPPGALPCARAAPEKVLGSEDGAFWREGAECGSPTAAEPAHFQTHAAPRSVGCFFEGVLGDYPRAEAAMDTQCMHPLHNHEIRMVRRVDPPTEPCALSSWVPSQGSASDPPPSDPHCLSSCCAARGRRSRSFGDHAK